MPQRPAPTPIEDLTDALVQGLSPEKFAQLVQLTAALFARLKAEAIRRGVWDDLKRQRPA